MSENRKIGKKEENEEENHLSKHPKEEEEGEREGEGEDEVVEMEEVEEGDDTEDEDLEVVAPAVTSSSSLKDTLNRLKEEKEEKEREQLEAADRKRTREREEEDDEHHKRRKTENLDEITFEQIRPFWNISLPSQWNGFRFLKEIREKEADVSEGDKKFLLFLLSSQLEEKEDKLVDLAVKWNVDDVMDLLEKGEKSTDLFKELLQNPNSFLLSQFAPSLLWSVSVLGNVISKCCSGSEKKHSSSVAETTLPNLIDECLGFEKEKMIKKKEKDEKDGKEEKEEKTETDWSSFCNILDHLVPLLTEAEEALIAYKNEEEKKKIEEKKESSEGEGGSSKSSDDGEKEKSKKSTEEEELQRARANARDSIEGFYHVLRRYESKISAICKFLRRTLEEVESSEYRKWIHGSFCRQAAKLLIPQEDFLYDLYPEFESLDDLKEFESLYKKNMSLVERRIKNYHLALKNAESQFDYIRKMREFFDMERGLCEAYEERMTLPTKKYSSLKLKPLKELLVVVKDQLKDKCARFEKDLKEKMVTSANIMQFSEIEEFIGKHKIAVAAATEQVQKLTNALEVTDRVIAIVPDSSTFTSSQTYYSLSNFASIERRRDDDDRRNDRRNDHRRNDRDFRDRDFRGDRGDRDRDRDRDRYRDRDRNRDNRDQRRWVPRLGGGGGGGGGRDRDRNRRAGSFGGRGGGMGGGVDVRQKEQERQRRLQEQQLMSKEQQLRQEQMKAQQLKQQLLQQQQQVLYQQQQIQQQQQQQQIQHQQQTQFQQPATNFQQPQRVVGSVAQAKAQFQQQMTQPPPAFPSGGGGILPNVPGTPWQQPTPMGPAASQHQLLPRPQYQQQQQQHFGGGPYRR